MFPKLYANFLRIYANFGHRITELLFSADQRSCPIPHHFLGFAKINERPFPRSSEQWFTKQRVDFCTSCERSTGAVVGHGN